MYERAQMKITPPTILRASIQDLLKAPQNSTANDSSAEARW